jgi:hypothetical protein
MVFLYSKNEVSADFSVNFQKSAYIAYDCTPLVAQPYQHFLRMAVDLTHTPHLPASFLVVCLVDA